MANWIEAPDPRSQAESRMAPYFTGRINDNSRVRIPRTLHGDLMRAMPDAQSVFDLIAMRLSRVFPSWKGTRCDFRFADQDNTPVFALTPRVRFIRVEIRTDRTGYRDRHNLFPEAPGAASQYPGDWVRANVAEPHMAEAIARDVETQLMGRQLR